MAKRSVCVVYVLTCLTFLFTSGCSTWRGVLVSNVTPEEAESLVGKRVKFYMDDGQKWMTVRSVDYPYFEGTEFTDFYEPHGEIIRVDLRKVQRMQVYKTDVGKGARWVLFVGVVVIAASFIVVSSAFGN